MRVLLPKGYRTINNVRGVNQLELFSALERQHRRAARIIFGLPSDMPSAQVLDTSKWNTLSHLYKLSLMMLIYKGYNSLLPHALVDQLINRN